MRDTSQQVDEIHAAIIRGLPGAARLRQAFEASDLARELSLTRLRLAYPTLSEDDLVVRLMRERLRPDELPPALR